MRYYDISPLWDKGAELKAPFIGAIGGKGNGKTYSAIHKALQLAFKNNRPFVYLRRMKEMIMKSNIQTLLEPHIQDIINLSGGKYNGVKLVSGVFYAYNKENKKTKVKPLCFTRALATLESQTGADLGELSCVIFDEFLSRERTLHGEFEKLIIAHSNFIRNRTSYYCPFILLGNTFTKDSDLLTQFGLNAYNLKQDTVTVSKSRSGEVRLILEYCGIATVQEEAAKSYYDRFDNEQIKMVSHGSWILSDYALMLQNYKYQKPICTIGIQSHKGRILIDVCYDNTLFVHIYRPTKEHNLLLLLSEQPVKSLKQRTFHTIPNLPIISNIIRCIAANRIYCDVPESVELLRDICNDIAGGESIRKYLK